MLVAGSDSAAAQVDSAAVPPLALAPEGFAAVQGWVVVQAELVPAVTIVELAQRVARQSMKAAANC